MHPTHRYVTSSLELHLFFARIMKEHSLFLEAGFTPANPEFAKKAEHLKGQFEQVLTMAVKLTDGGVRPAVLTSGEIFTPFTFGAERQTQKLTAIEIDQSITAAEAELTAQATRLITPQLVQETRRLNQMALTLLNSLIELKERIIHDVSACCMFTMNYPLLIKHILREAKLYRSYVIALENGRSLDDVCMRQTEQFWNQIMMEHALFIRGLLDPSEDALIRSADGFAQDYALLLEQSKTRTAQTTGRIVSASLVETQKFRDFKAAGTKGICACEIQSIILPLLADHVLREANHFIRLLET